MKTGKKRKTGMQPRPVRREPGKGSGDGPSWVESAIENPGDHGKEFSDEIKKLGFLLAMVSAGRYDEP